VIEDFSASTKLIEAAMTMGASRREIVMGVVVLVCVGLGLRGVIEAVSGAIGLLGGG